MSVASLSLSEIYKPDYEYNHHKPGYSIDISKPKSLT